MAPRPAALVAVVATIIALLGCSNEGERQPIAHWMFQQRAVELPANLYDHGLPLADADYTLRTTAELSPALRGQELSLTIDSFPVRTSLLVDGAIAVEERPPIFDGYRRALPTSFRLPASATADGVVTLELVVMHRWRRSGWFNAVPFLTPADRPPTTTALAYVFNQYLAAAAALAMLQVGLTCVLVYLLDRKRRPYLWFGIQALFAIYYCLFLIGVPAPVLGVYDVPPIVWTLGAALTASVYFTHSFFGLGAPSRLWPVAGGLVCAAGLLAVDPWWTTVVGAPPLVLFLGCVGIYQVIIGVRLLRTHEDPTSAALLLAAWIALVGTDWADGIPWLGCYPDVMHGVRFSTVGLMAFPLFISLLLGRSHVISLRQADRLNVQLGDRVAELETKGIEIQQLNLELRRQIADRSTQISAALALAHAGNVPPTLKRGDIVQGRYEIRKRIGKGGMGDVFEATRLSDSAVVAIKLTRHADDQMIARLAREAQLACSVSHPNVVTMLDVDIATEGFLFVVMELVRGPTLADERERFGVAGSSLAILAQICAGLAALHEAGVVHRDLKPANLLLTGDIDTSPQVKITDFGVSRPEMQGPEHTEVTRVSGAVSSPPSSSPHSSSPMFLTQAGQQAGTPMYMAPELADEDVHVRTSSDMFSFGIIAYEMLAGHLPFETSAFLARMQGRDLEPPPRLSTQCGGLASDVARAIDACLSFDPKTRPTATALADILARAASAKVPARASSSS